MKLSGVTFILTQNAYITNLSIKLLLLHLLYDWLYRYDKQKAEIKISRVFLCSQMLTVESAIEQLDELALLFYRWIVFV